MSLLNLGLLFLLEFHHCSTPDPMLGTPLSTVPWKMADPSGSPASAKASRGTRHSHSEVGLLNLSQGFSLASSFAVC